MSLTSSDERCKKKPTKGNDFCQSHIKKHHYCDESIQNIRKEIKDDKYENEYIDLIFDNFDKCRKNAIKYLDENYQHCLLGLSDSWNDVPFMYWYKCDNMWWDIRSLIKIFAQQLNQSELEKPFPIFIENPFTRKRISLDDIHKLRDYFSGLPKTSGDNCNMRINKALNKFINFTNAQLNVISLHTTQYTQSNEINRLFCKSLRYKMINYKDSQGRYCGYWVNINTPPTEFEMCYNEITTATLLFNDAFVIDTPIYRHIVKLLNSIPKEEYEL